MKPTITGKNYELYLGDCRDVMSEMKPESVDSIITDPPFGIAFNSSHVDYRRDIANDGFDEWKKMMNEVYPLMKKIMTPKAVLAMFCGGGGKTPVSAHATLDAIQYFNLIQTVIWFKKTIGLGWRYRPSYETILVLSKDPNNYNWFAKTKDVSNILSYNCIIPSKDDHPTPKPPPLIHRLQELHTPLGGTTIDPFMGGGTAGQVAMEAGFKYIGVELDEQYFEMAAKRIENASCNLSELF